jgi:hypothetical protein
MYSSPHDPIQSLTQNPDLYYPYYQQDGIAVHINHRVYSDPNLRVSMWKLVLKPTSTFLRPWIMQQFGCKLRRASLLLLQKCRVARC